MIDLLGLLAQSSPDPTAALPGWIAGGGVAGILGWLLYRAEKRTTDMEHRIDAARTDADRRLDAAEERYREMVERYSSRTYEAAAVLGDAIETIRSLADRDDRGRPR